MKTIFCLFAVLAIAVAIPAPKSNVDWEAILAVVENSERNLTEDVDTVIRLAHQASDIYGPIIDVRLTVHKADCKQVFDALRQSIAEQRLTVLETLADYTKLGGYHAAASFDLTSELIHLPIEVSVPITQILAGTLGNMKSDRKEIIKLLKAKPEVAVVGGIRVLESNVDWEAVRAVVENTAKNVTEDVDAVIRLAHQASVIYGPLIDVRLTVYKADCKKVFDVLQQRISEQALTYLETLADYAKLSGLHTIASFDLLSETIHLPLEVSVPIGQILAGTPINMNKDRKEITRLLRAKPE